MPSLCIGVLLVLLVQQGSAEEHVRVLSTTDAGHTTPVDVTLDHSSLMTYIGKPFPPQDCFTKTINLHDFSRQLVAIKSVDNGVCFIKKSDETYAHVKALVSKIKDGRLQSVNQTVEQLMLPRKEIEPKDVEMTVGSMLANFCSGYKVWWLYDTSVLHSLPRVTKRHITICIFCWFKSAVRAQISPSQSQLKDSTFSLSQSKESAVRPSQLKDYQHTDLEELLG